MAVDRREDDMGTMAWPGFVDILSSVIIMFIFFVMVIVVVLYIHTIKFTSEIKTQAQESIKKQVEESLDPEMLSKLEEVRETQRQEIEELKKKNKEMESSLFSMKVKYEQLNAGYAETIGNQQMKVSDDEIIIFFEDNSVTIAEAMNDKVKEFFELSKNAKLFKISAGDFPDEALKLNARELNLARMLNIRNAAIETGIDTKNIDIGFAPSERIDGHDDWVRITIEK